MILFCFPKFEWRKNDQNLVLFVLSCLMCVKKQTAEPKILPESAQSPNIFSNFHPFTLNHFSVCWVRTLNIQFDSWWSMSPKIFLIKLNFFLHFEMQSGQKTILFLICVKSVDFSSATLQYLQMLHKNDKTNGFSSVQRMPTFIFKTSTSMIFSCCVSCMRKYWEGSNQFKNGAYEGHIKWERANPAHKRMFLLSSPFLYACFYNLYTN